MSTPTKGPLTDREKFWATALGLGKIMRNPKSKEEGEKIWQGLQLLGGMMTDEFEAELMELAKRNSNELKDLIEDKKESMWPTI